MKDETYGRRSADLAIHERVSSLEANYGSMDKSINALTDTISKLNGKIDTVTSRISTGAGVFAATVFFLEVILVPILLIILKQHIS
jgi:hypothetical protein